MKSSTKHSYRSWCSQSMVAGRTLAIHSIINAAIERSFFDDESYLVTLNVEMLNSRVRIVLII